MINIHSFELRKNKNVYSKTIIWLFFYANKQKIMPTFEFEHCNTWKWNWEWDKGRASDKKYSVLSQKHIREDRDNVEEI